MLAVCWPYVGRMLAVCLPCSGRMLAVCWPYVGRMLAVYWPYVGRMLAIPNRPISPLVVYILGITLKSAICALGNIDLSSRTRFS